MSHVVKGARASILQVAQNSLLGGGEGEGGGEGGGGPPGGNGGGGGEGGDGGGGGEGGDGGGEQSRA